MTVASMSKPQLRSQPDTERGPSLLTTLAPLVKPLGRRWVLACVTILAGLGKFSLPLIVGYAAKVVIDSLASSELSAVEQKDILQYWVIVSIIATLACAVATYFRAALGQRLSAFVQHALRRRLFNHLQRLGMEFFAKHHAGALGSRVSSDIQHVAMVIDRGLITMAMDAGTILIIAIILFSTNWLLALFAFIVMALSGISVAYHAPRLRRQRKAMQEEQSAITGRAAETFAGISLVKAYAGEGATGSAFNAHSADLQNLQVRTSRLQGRFQSISLTLIMAAQLVVLGAGGWLVLQGPDVLSIGGLVLFLTYLRWIEGSVQRVVDGMIQIQDGLAALERVNDMLGIDPNPLLPPEGKQPKLGGAVEFSQVDFGYQPDRMVLRDFDQTFEAGRSYALVGPSGGGKSSLCKLMLRFYDPGKGSVRIDGHDLRDLDLDYFRQRVAVVLQDPILFSTTIFDNIAFGVEGATREQVEAAAKASQAHEFIMDLPEGYDAPLGERGVNLSGGQRQRIALARALMRDPCLLILDEATSALDSVTERSIQEVIDGLKGSRTIIIIAHRLSTVKNVDDIVVVESGRVTESGPYDRLVKRGGTFSRLVEEQALAQAT